MFSLFITALEIKILNELATRIKEKGKKKELRIFIFLSFSARIIDT